MGRNRTCKHAKEEKAFREISKSLGREDLSLINDVAAWGLNLQLVILRLYFCAHDFAAVHRFPGFTNLPSWKEDRSVISISLYQLNCDSTLAAEADIVAHNLMHHLKRRLVTH